ncbi:hypothetical protein HD806DRAFT_530919 [Xylariaceae sp. AK1471]|nr:hypothetical protein HD806DRAFT_530919 [Xylariaceae sp. AK1471]
MGWIWSSGSAPKGNASSDSSSSNTNTNSSNTENQSSPPKAPESMYSDPEIAKFMAQIQADFGGNSNTASTRPSPPEPKKASKSPTPSQAPSPSSSWWPSWGSSSPSQPTTSSTSSRMSQPPSPTTPARLDPVAESLLPTDMSCRQAFDQAFHCNSLAGQWTAVYREGTVRSCSEQWDDFWFCMRTRAHSGTVKEEAIKDHYRQKELKKYGSGMPNSTDVWEPRTEKLPVGASFQGRYEKPDISDEEWRRQEIQRRRMIQHMLKEEERAVV